MIPVANLQICRNEEPWDTSLEPFVSKLSMLLGLAIDHHPRARPEKNALKRWMRRGVRIHDREISPLLSPPPTFPPHTNLVTYVHASGRDRRYRARVSQQITKGRQPGGDRCILPLSIYVRGARCRSWAKMGNDKRKKKLRRGKKRERGKEWET